MSEQPKFTPGPWEWGKEDWADQWFLKPGILILDGDGGGPDGVDEFDTANAHLIAAAPDLYAALEGLMALNDDHAPFGGEIYQDRVTRAWDAARAALAKAKGVS